MKHHSPNFLNNLEEVEKAPHVNLWTGIKWTAILFATLFALFSLTSCNKEVSTTDIPQLSAPDNRPVPITITVRLYKFQQSWGLSWILEVTHPKILTSATKVTIAWKDDRSEYVIPVTTPSGFRQTTATIIHANGIAVTAKGEATDIKLVSVEGGEKNVFYTIKIVP